MKHQHVNAVFVHSTMTTWQGLIFFFAAGSGQASSGFSAGVPLSRFQATTSWSCEAQDFARVARAPCAPSLGSTPSSSAKTRALVHMDAGQDTTLSLIIKTISIYLYMPIKNTSKYFVIIIYFKLLLLDIYLMPTDHLSLSAVLRLLSQH